MRVYGTKKSLTNLIVLFEVLCNVIFAHNLTNNYLYAYVGMYIGSDMPITASALCFVPFVMETLTF